MKCNAQAYLLPALAIMCWPSFAFFTSGIGKDSLSFFLIPSVLLAFNQVVYRKEKLSLAVPFLLFTLLFMTFIRPYLLMIMSAAFFVSMFKGVKTLSIGRICLIILSAPVFLYAVYWVLKHQGGLESIEASDIINRAYKQQTVLNYGTTFPMLSTNPFIVFLSLPYSFVMNLIMPLFIFAHGLTALMASFENLVLAGFLYRFLKRKQYWREMKKRSDFAKLCFYTFMFGMALLSLLNTNLGLAMRQKSMYVPGFLVVFFAVQLHVKQLRAERRATYYAGTVSAVS
ncbi:MAG: hypothetical protein P1U32_05750 [Legionellaceae bacterium]|nr:hypothetical protein [Legionellaceae bacterium]